MALDDAGLDLLFREARSHNAFTARRGRCYRSDRRCGFARLARAGGCDRRYGCDGCHG